MARLHVFRGQGAFDRACTAKREDQQVCGVLLDSGHPAYFLMPAGASDPEVRDQAFAVRHGRAIQPMERRLLETAEMLRARRG